MNLVVNNKAEIRLMIILALQIDVEDIVIDYKTNMYVVCHLQTRRTQT